MNISSGISQLTFQTRIPGKTLVKKAYLWPQYNAGKITGISPVQEKINPELHYVKRSTLSSDNDDYINQIKNSASYNSTGNLIKNTSEYFPGSFFEALA